MSQTYTYYGSTNLSFWSFPAQPYPTAWGTLCTWTACPQASRRSLLWTRGGPPSSSCNRVDSISIPKCTVGCFYLRQQSCNAGIVIVCSLFSLISYQRVLWGPNGPNICINEYRRLHIGHEKTNDEVAWPPKGVHDQVGVPQVHLLDNSERLEAWNQVG